jgi:hypothetical protein
MANYQTHLESSRNLEQAFQNEVEQAQNAEVKSFYQKLASEQRTITNQLQNKVNNNTQTNTDGTTDTDGTTGGDANA